MYDIGTYSWINKKKKQKRKKNISKVIETIYI